MGRRKGGDASAWGRPSTCLTSSAEWTPDAPGPGAELARTPEQRAKDTEGALVQVEGPGGTSVWATREEAKGKPVGRAPTSEGALVQVVGPDGVVTWQTREQAEGKRAPRPATGGLAGGGVAADVAEFADAYIGGDTDALRGLTPTMNTKVRAEIMRRGGTPPPAGRGWG